MPLLSSFYCIAWSALFFFFFFFDNQHKQRLCVIATKNCPLHLLAFALRCSSLSSPPLSLFLFFVIWLFICSFSFPPTNSAEQHQRHISHTHTHTHTHSLLPSVPHPQQQQWPAQSRQPARPPVARPPVSSSPQRLPASPPHPLAA